MSCSTHSELLENDLVCTAVLNSLSGLLNNAVNTIQTADHNIRRLHPCVFKTQLTGSAAFSESEASLCQVVSLTVLHLFCQKDIEKTIVTYTTEPQKEGNLKSGLSAVESLYRIYPGSLLLTCLNTLIAQRCSELRKHAGKVALSVLPFSFLINTASYPEPAENFRSCEREITEKNVAHVLSAVRHFEQIVEIKRLRNRLEQTKVSLEAKFEGRLSRDHLKMVKKELDKIGLTEQISCAELLVLDLEKRVNAKKNQLSAVHKAQQDFQSFQQDVFRRQIFIERLRLESHALISKLPSKQQSHQLKAELLHNLLRTRQLLDTLMTVNPWNQVFLYLGSSDSATLVNWRVPSLNCSLRSLPHNVLPNSQLYTDCCRRLGLHENYRHPTAVLRKMLLLVNQGQIASEEVEHLRDVLLVLKEESRTTADMQKRDSRIQEKVIKQIQPQLERINSIIDNLQTRISRCQCLLTDWSKITITNLVGVTENTEVSGN
ncbi:hypothetical protein EG68_10459 [Paragonimus skrjabini miyazakii]|uniref:Uncharacterized protein n=1 Tax=Paragonimus skrjabini miyazakii TaxID=59628 RepID=A0A8S9Y839_9TREM|nr:hypothetical protein EG68_10459 [Paragonimus skrjabini miyazakii]